VVVGSLDALENVAVDIIDEVPVGEWALVLIDADWMSFWGDKRDQDLSVILNMFILLASSPP